MLDLEDKAFLKTLRMLKIVTRRFFRGQKVGQRRSQQKGASVEFKDYKDYNPGDDPRFLDWNVYGRLDKLLVKLFHNEEDLHVYNLIDSSQSMLFGSPSKFDHARKLAAAISYLATAGQDRSTIQTFAQGLREQSSVATRPGHVFNHFHWLEKVEAGGEGQFGRTIDEFLVRHKRRGAVFIHSDFLMNDPVEESLRRLRFNKYEVFLVQVLTEEELAPPFSGMFRFVDSETHLERELYVDYEALETYRQVVEEFTGGLESFAHRNGMSYVRASTAVPFESTVLQFFRPVKAAGTTTLAAGAGGQ
ncbi:MAG: DUF58 domain-containing protein [Candidatus Riflebacteria bacterium]|nr:DUF58 domain-containing protein [Candidatus Riflebacteria bacterium]